MLPLRIAKALALLSLLVLLQGTTLIQRGAVPTIAFEGQAAQSSGTTLTVASVAPTAGQCLVVGMQATAEASTTVDVTGVVWNSQALTEAQEITCTVTTFERDMSWWYLPISAGATSNVVATLTFGNLYWAAITVYVLDGATCTPHLLASTTTNCASSSTSVSTAVSPTAPFALGLDMLANLKASGTLPVEVSPQTPHDIRQHSTAGQFATSSEPYTGAGAQSMGWTYDATGSIMHYVVVFAGQ